MKTVFYSLLIGVLFISNIYSCTKDETTNDNYADVDQSQIVQSRSGTYYPFNYPISQVTLDDFKVIYTIQNQNKLDSTVYILHANDQSFRYGIYWQVYEVIYHYKDGTKLKELVNAPKSLGNRYVKIPDVNQNQLNIANPENWVMLYKTKKFDKYFSEWCGKELNHWTWKVTTSLGVNTTQTIDPTNCGGYHTLLQYSLIF